jgi:hypothetical protein
MENVQYLALYYSTADGCLEYLPQLPSLKSLTLLETNYLRCDGSPPTEVNREFAPNSGGCIVRKELIALMLKAKRNRITHKFSEVQVSNLLGPRQW